MTHKNLLKIIMETVNNPINIILKNPNILYHGFLLNIYINTQNISNINTKNFLILSYYQFVWFDTLYLKFIEYSFSVVWSNPCLGRLPISKKKKKILYDQHAHINS